jgi:hypothetical protein
MVWQEGGLFKRRNERRVLSGNSRNIAGRGKTIVALCAEAFLARKKSGIVACARLGPQ